MRERIAGLAGNLFLRALNRTLRWEKTGLSRGGEHWAFGEPVILTLWHCDQLLGPYCYVGAKPLKGHLKRKPRPFSALTSQHSDGRIICEILRNYSIGNIAGSSSRGGVRALVEMKRRILIEKEHISITPDGPKGPPRVAKAGIIGLSSKSGAPILPIAVAYRNYWEISSWDRMLVPKPFTKARMIAGPLIHVPRHLLKEQISEECEKLSSVLNQLKAEAEKEVLS